ncbi:Peroxidase superfamily protein [Euphorbia peplus]|nr:Peroxidase superfamily protein [Euphorbia peplus]
MGFYSRSCPIAESIVKNTVESAFSSDRQSAARLLRLFFHDCFVQGCDGSILIDNGNSGERGAIGNSGLANFEVIEKAKRQLEAKCPGVVSCADILALAARDAVALSGGPLYEIPTGRRDGRVSKVSLAANLPEVDDSIRLLKRRFTDKGFSLQDFVLLTAGAHTIGTSACFFMRTRLYDFNGNGDSDPSISPKLLGHLKAKCPKNGDVNVRLPLDWSSDSKFDDHIFRNIKNGFAVIASDARLFDDNNTRMILESYIGSNKFKPDFAKAMIKLGNLGVKTGSQGEIRRICSVVN